MLVTAVREAICHAIAGLAIVLSTG